MTTEVPSSVVDRFLAMVAADDAGEPDETRAALRDELVAFITAQPERLWQSEDGHIRIVVDGDQNVHTMITEFPADPQAPSGRDMAQRLSPRQIEAAMLEGPLPLSDTVSASWLTHESGEVIGLVVEHAGHGEQSYTFDKWLRQAGTGALHLKSRAPLGVEPVLSCGGCGYRFQIQDGEVVEA